ncbi:MAG: hypothetical protein LBT43_21850, partial [Prevotella sp.]|nr:hypothetical protein [Prevotella sp.]
SKSTAIIICLIIKLFIILYFDFPLGSLTAFPTGKYTTSYRSVTVTIISSIQKSYFYREFTKKT